MAISSRVGRDSLGEASKRFFRVLAEEFLRIALAAMRSLVATLASIVISMAAHADFPEKPIQFQ
jgi:hypothetical protein